MPEDVVAALIKDDLGDGLCDLAYDTPQVARALAAVERAEPTGAALWIPDRGHAGSWRSYDWSKLSAHVCPLMVLVVWARAERLAGSGMLF